MHTISASCPYCGEPNTISLDESGGRTQRYVEDCQICCQPWSVEISFEDDDPVVALKTLDE